MLQSNISKARVNVRYVYDTLVINKLKQNCKCDDSRRWNICLYASTYNLISLFKHSTHFNTRNKTNGISHFEKKIRFNGCMQARGSRENVVVHLRFRKLYRRGKMRYISCAGTVWDLGQNFAILRTSHLSYLIGFEKNVPLTETGNAYILIA
jgi:hypothetical protein